MIILVFWCGTRLWSGDISCSLLTSGLPQALVKHFRLRGPRGSAVSPLDGWAVISALQLHNTSLSLSAGAQHGVGWGMPVSGRMDERVSERPWSIWPTPFPWLLIPPFVTRLDSQGADFPQADPQHPQSVLSHSEGDNAHANHLREKISLVRTH